ncbi:bifunctional phosphopantothenoylcysteine decarboxylase/phosphopantothenate--cysteine ligase CoaBC [Corynebacterium epidermidicanis]|uniref:Coenzyme A biosynthesis bifunctional protein CoaBC n=1 Tax=Corynebacterium epidermidicanis TaxID=1050174 RepID=A0A0G3GUN3_9CORY|nr:bifunctional phosphopantothenoylcysteine decarboxylase/phosphopantothenate--cysteine ligase CoaBC [Corynebacterium epidermidicanis]AKK03228.1 phosphopantothenoylcysteine decarboxylase/phosphopantothenate--cysteine ligase [Corynebacterium epidermidicanis]
MNTDEQLNIVVGVTGGIAAYKACHLVRYFKELGHDVRVVPTPNALNFVGKATFEALSGNRVSTTVFDAVEEVQHVRIGQEADLIVIAPATADFLARMVAGRGDDLLSATVLVATCPVVVAPAMHTEMWMHPATVSNVSTLRDRGTIVLEPASGRLTGVDSGPGRLPEPEQIGSVALAIAKAGALPRDFEGARMLITAGGTQENIDPVRFIGNRSSGRQGFALAEVAVQRGAKVTIVAGATDDLPTPPQAKVVRVTSAIEMADAVAQRAGDHDVFIMAAAVADFRPATQADAKLKKGNDDDALASVVLVENPDILASTVEQRVRGEVSPQSVIMGFAAETGSAEHTPLELAEAKLQRKGCDLLMLNEVGHGKVFGQLDNQGVLLSASGEREVVPAGTKFDCAVTILDRVAEVWTAKACRSQ